MRYQALTRLSRFFTEVSLTKGRSAPDKKFMDDMYAALGNDLDTPRMLARIWELVKDQTISPEATRASLIEADTLLGLGFTKRRPAAKLKVGSEPAVPQEVKDLVAEREQARANKNFASADLLRDKIEALGYDLKDTPEGSEISPKN
jgi:cysteinyl-tRNA synthetase